jgi:hypothetical protein
VLYLAVRNLDEYRSPSVGDEKLRLKQALQAFMTYFEGRIPTQSPPRSLTQAARHARQRVAQLNATWIAIPGDDLTVVPIAWGVVEGLGVQRWVVAGRAATGRGLGRW